MLLGRIVSQRTGLKSDVDDAKTSIESWMPSLQVAYIRMTGQKRIPILVGDMFGAHHDKPMRRRGGAGACRSWPKSVDALSNHLIRLSNYHVKNGFLTCEFQCTSFNPVRGAKKPSTPVQVINN
ncbi:MULTISPECIES: hypothetical protein [Burkholderia]|uniref:hypothetical protein n=1 Tax=Burkholderia TaxID=32008 RepID=UPI000A99DAA4|nr:MULTISPECIES: hypothetical protein [Burkholderia]